MGSIGSHYDVLGVAPTATTEEIRAAYRRLARLHHPDLQVGIGDDRSGDMRDLNAAYAVLADPVRRHEYDRTTRAVPHPEPSPPTRRPPTRAEQAVSGALVTPGPARFPWRVFVVGSVIGAGVVIGLSATRGPAAVPPPDGVLHPGSCVAIESNTDAREISCTPEAALQVREIVGFDEPCPIGTVGHRDRQGSGMACVEPIPVAEE